MGQKQWALSAAGAAADFDTGADHGNLNIRVTGPAANSVVILETSEDETTWNVEDTVTGPNWGYAAAHRTARYVRPNVASLGTGASPLAVVITWGS